MGERQTEIVKCKLLQPCYLEIGLAMRVQPASFRRMRYFTLLVSLVILPLAALSAVPALAENAGDRPSWSIAIHGGAGTMDRERMTPEQQAEYKAALQNALDAGAEVLRNGGTAMDAVKAAITPMEDDPRFNAGRGSVFTWEGVNEMDAALMDDIDEDVTDEAEEIEEAVEVQDDDQPKKKRRRRRGGRGRGGRRQGHAPWPPLARRRIRQSRTGWRGPAAPWRVRCSGGWRVRCVAPAA